MRESDLDKVLNYMKQYVENKYEHDSEPMLNWEDLQLVLNKINELEKQNEILKEALYVIWNEEIDIDYNELQQAVADIKKANKIRDDGLHKMIFGVDKE